MTDRLVRVPSGPGKPEALREAVKKQIDAAFGNSRWDLEMLGMAKYAFAVNPNPDLNRLRGSGAGGFISPRARIAVELTRVVSLASTR